jgi:Sulfatase
MNKTSPPYSTTTVTDHEDPKHTVMRPRGPVIGPAVQDKIGNRIWQALVVAAASAFSPMTAWANAGENPILPTLALAIAVLVAVGLVSWQVLKRFKLDGLGSAYAVAMFMLIATNVGGLVGKYHSLDRIAFLSLAVVLSAIAYRLRKVRLFEAGMTWFVLFLIAYPVVNIVTGPVSSGEPSLDADRTLQVTEMSERPDILVVFLDAYGSREVLQEYYGFDNGPTLRTLEKKGFTAPGSVSANYARTQLAIPTFLQLDYVARAGKISDADTDQLLQVMSGQNRLASALQGQGYRQVHVESGWLGSTCGPTVDVCVSAPWPDETLYDVIYRTILLDLPGFELGRSFTNGALHGALWLKTELSTYLNDDQPDFIFAHMLLPHPPLFLDDKCNPDWKGGQPGFAIGQRGADEAATAEARIDYVKQVQCANSLMIEIADLLGDDDVALFLGDHGPDLQGQLFQQSSLWTANQVRERYGAFLATKVPGCDMDRIESLVNVGRRMLGCLSGEAFADLPTHTFDLNKEPDGQVVIELEAPSS